MSVKRRRVICDVCQRVGGAYGPSHNLVLRELRTRLAEAGWTRPSGPRPGAPAWATKQQTTLDVCPGCAS